MDTADIEKAVLAVIDEEQRRSDPLKLWPLAAATTVIAGISGVLSLAAAALFGPSQAEYSPSVGVFGGQKITPRGKDIEDALRASITRYQETTGRKIPHLHFLHGDVVFGHELHISESALMSHKGLYFFMNRLIKGFEGKDIASAEVRDKLDYYVAHELGHFNNRDHYREFSPMLPKYLAVLTAATALSLLGHGIAQIPQEHLNIIPLTGKDPVMDSATFWRNMPYYIVHAIKYYAENNASLLINGSGKAAYHLATFTLQGGAALAAWAHVSEHMANAHAIEHRADLHHAQLHGIEKTITVLMQQDKTVQLGSGKARIRPYYSALLFWQEALAAPDLTVRRGLLERVVNNVRDVDSVEREKHIKEYGRDPGSRYPTEGMRLLFLLEGYQRVLDARIMGQPPARPQRFARLRQYFSVSR